MKVHTDPRKPDPNISFEAIRSIDKLVTEKLRPMSVEPNQRNSFENWFKYKTAQEKLKKFYYQQELSKDKSSKVNQSQDSDHPALVFEDWLKNKKNEEKRMKKLANQAQVEEIKVRLKQQQDGVSYKQWLKQSLLREKSEKRKKREIEVIKEEKMKEIEVQKEIEKEAKKLVERKKRNERLSRLNFRKQDEHRETTQSPLLLAYSPNKYAAGVAGKSYS